MKVGLPILIAGALMGVAAPARAQDADMRAASQKQADRMMQQFADCVDRSARLRPQVDRFLRLAPNTAEYGSVGERLATDRCVPRSVGSVRMQFNGILLRLGLFEVRYRRQFGRGPVPALGEVPTLDLAAEFEPAGVTVSQETVFLRVLGNCVIRNAAAQAHALVISKLYEDDERVALAALMPTLAVCTPEGQTLRFSRPMLRGAVAEALFKAATRQQTETPPPAAASTPPSTN